MLGLSQRYLKKCDKSLRSTISSLWRDRSGNFALMFALCSVPVVVALGCSVDYVQAINTHRRMQSALDAALVAAVKEVGTKDSTALKTEIANWLEAESVQKGYYVLNTNTIAIDATNSTIKASVTATVPTTFLKIAGVNNVPVAVTSAVAGGPDSISKNAFSMYLVLDRSGSMDEDTKTTYTTTCYTIPLWKWGAYTCTKKYKKIEALKLAVGSLMGQFSTSDPDTKYVRTGAVAYDLEMYGNVALAWGEEATLNFVNTLTADGGTNSSDAFKLAYESVTAATEITAHKNKNGQTPAKYIVFMTDGDNNKDKQNGDSYDINTKYWCDQARTNGVGVYTIAFMAPKKGQDLLKYCATTAENFFAAEDTSDLVDAFKIIGETSSKTIVRLTQ